MILQFCGSTPQTRNEQKAVFQGQTGIYELSQHNHNPRCTVQQGGAECLTVAVQTSIS